MLCTDDQTLEERLNEYSKYFYMSGWKRQKAQKELKRGAAKNRKKLIHQKRKKDEKKIAWLTTYDPRLPSKSNIIRKKNVSILYSEAENRSIFPNKLIISA